MPEDDSGLRRTVASFRRHGFVFPIEVFSAEEKLHFRFGVGVREHVLLSTELSLDDAEARLLLYLRL